MEAPNFQPLKVTGLIHFMFTGSFFPYTVKGMSMHIQDKVKQSQWSTYNLLGVKVRFADCPDTCDTQE